MTKFSYGRSALFASVSVALLIACGSNTDEAVARADLAEGCNVNSDCSDPLVCAFRACHDKCTTSRDCPDGQRCVNSDKPFHVCQLPLEKGCSSNAQCPTGQICGVDNQCRDECTSDRDCIAGQLCVSRTCADVTELTPMGTLPIPADAGPDAASAPGTPCDYTSECNDPLICRNNLCVYECLGTRDCMDGLTCTDHRCKGATSGGDGGTDGTVADTSTPIDATLPGTDAADAGLITEIPDGAPDGYAKGCILNSDCPTGLVCKGLCVYECNGTADCDTAHGACCAPWHVCVTGPVCTQADPDAGQSVPDAATSDGGKTCANDSDCQDGAFCDGIERCTGGRCQPPAYTACDDSNPCTTDTCNEGAKSCAHASIGPQDQDHDGHYAASCGGGADDCDDTNAAVYPGHPEVCNFVDNNCNGQIDEGKWTYSAPVSFGGGLISDSPPEAPSIARLNDGTFAVGWPAYNETALEAWKLSASLVPSVNYTPVVDGYGGYYYYSRVITDGTHLMFAGLSGPNGQRASVGYTNGDLTGNTRASFVLDGSYAYAVSLPALGWLPALNKFAAVWPDPHLGTPNTTATLYTAYVDAAGNISSERQLMGNQSDVAISIQGNGVSGASGGRSSRPQMAVGNNSILVAWTLNSTSHVRWALFDLALSSVIAGPFDATEDDSVLALDVTWNGSMFALLTSDANETTARVRQIDSASALTTGALTIGNNNSPTSDFHLAVVGPGYGITMSYGTEVLFGWAPTNLAVPFTLTEIGQAGIGQATSGAGIATVDSKHVAIVWNERNNNQLLRASLLTCGP